eukprot:TRINITY_DN8398_c0_g1_i1.p1 TRINITY_DN8398_c0_g1~~TRINITY_DN8398_c0_g1_i1.p1  ORF type:complete len:555 (+),score=98.62 TRINITY_DN8398_c0_g1_i1:332-1996(+)
MAMQAMAHQAFKQAWSEFGGEGNSWEAAKSKPEFVGWLVDQLERVTGHCHDQFHDHNIPVYALVQLCISPVTPSQPAPHWPPTAPSLNTTRLVFEAGGFGSILQQLRRLLVTISKRSVTMNKTPEESQPRPPRSRGTQSSDPAKPDMWSCIHPWLALVWCLIIADELEPSAQLCTPDDMLEVVTLVLSALAAPSGSGEGCDKPVGMVILLYHSLVRSIGEPPRMSCNPPGLGTLTLKPSPNPEAEFGVQLRRKFPWLGSRLVPDLPTPLREAYNIFNNAAESHADETRRTNPHPHPHPQVGRGVEGGKPHPRPHGVEGVLPRPHGVEGVLPRPHGVEGVLVRSCEVTLGSSCKNVASMIALAMQPAPSPAVQPSHRPESMGNELNQDLEVSRTLERKRCVLARTDVLVEAATESITILIKLQRGTQGSVSQLCQAVLTSNLLPVLLRFLCTRIGPHPGDFDFLLSSNPGDSWGLTPSEDGTVGSSDKGVNDPSLRPGCEATVMTDQGGSHDSGHGGGVGHDSPVSYTHLRAHETPEHLVCRLLLEKKKKTIKQI